MRLGERVLSKLSRRVGAPDYVAGRSDWTLDTALDVLKEVIPDFQEKIEGKDVLDFGCGAGYQVIALAQLGAKRVVGLDSNRRILAEADSLLQNTRTTKPSNVEFVNALEKHHECSFDIVVCQNSMEHFVEPRTALATMRSALKPHNGQIIITFNPPWLAPYGAHMHFFTKVPWVHLLFSEKTVMRVRSKYRDDGARRYEDVEGGLGRLTVRRFERLLKLSGLQVVFSRYDCVKRLNAIASVPLVRELFTTRVSCVLTAHPT